MNINTAGLAIGFLELKGAVYGVTAVDAAAKAASVEILQAKVACPGKFVVILAGEMAAVEAAMAAARAVVGSGLYDFCILGRIHPALYWGLYDQFPQALGGEEGAMGEDSEALGIVETLNIAAGLAAADQALKTAEVKLGELRLGYALGGRTYFIIFGATSAVQAALAGAVQVASHRGALGSQSLIPRPTKKLARLYRHSQAGLCMV